MNKDMIRPLGMQGAQAIAHGLTAGFAAITTGCREFLIRCVEQVLIIRVDHNHDRVDPRMLMKRSQSAAENRLAIKVTILFRQTAARPVSTPGSNNQGSSFRG
jgi:hypothetical protein